MATTSITKRVQMARDIMKKLKELDATNASLYWLRAGEIYRLKNGNLWKFAYGDDGMTWGNFCVQELNTPKSSADQKAKNYAFFVGKHGFKPKELAPYDAYALYYIAEHKESEPKKVVESLMQDSLNMTRKDFIADIRGVACDHKEVHVEEEKKQVCDKCHKVVLKLKDGKNKTKK